MIEEWKIYKCKKDKNHPYASVWEISSYGRVKRDGVIIEPKLGNWGYLIFSDALVHKAVAEMFIPKTKEDITLNRTCVDHIDGNKLNNHVENLRWCTHIENISFPLARYNQWKATKVNGFKGRPPKKPVVQLDLNNNFIAEFPSVLEAGEICGIWKGGISTVLHGKQKTAGGYKWMYKEDYQKCIN